MQNEFVVALMGAGRAGQEHATNLGSLPNVRVALICDPVKEAARVAAKLASAEKTTDSPDEVFAGARTLRFFSPAKAAHLK